MWSAFCVLGPLLRGLHTNPEKLMILSLLYRQGNLRLGNLVQTMIKGKGVKYLLRSRYIRYYCGRIMSLRPDNPEFNS